VTRTTSIIDAPQWWATLLLLLTSCSATGCRNGGIHAGTPILRAMQAAAEAPVALPNQDGSFKFCVLGDFGTGERPQYDLAEQMVKLREKFRYDVVVLVGDNLYGAERPQDFHKKFEVPYRALLDGGVKFYASL